MWQPFDVVQQPVAASSMNVQLGRPLQTTKGQSATGAACSCWHWASTAQGLALAGLPLVGHSAAQRQPQALHAVAPTARHPLPLLTGQWRPCAPTSTELQWRQLTACCEWNPKHLQGSRVLYAWTKRCEAAQITMKTHSHQALAGKRGWLGAWTE